MTGNAICRKGSWLFTMVLTLSLTLLSCGGGTSAPTPSPTSPHLVSIAVTPGGLSLAPKSTQQFTAVGTYADGSSKDLTNTVAWSSTSNATIGTGGLATAVKPGNATINAALSGISGTASLTITNPLVSVAITPPNPTITAGQKVQLTATGTYSDGTSSALTAGVAWSSSNSNVMSVDSTGLVQSLTAGSGVISASVGSISNSTSLIVVPQNPPPTVDAISPNSSEQSGPGFTLSVIGSNFSPASSVQWNDGNLPTTYVNDMLLTANVPATAVASAGTSAVTVVNPGAGGGSSNVVTFSVPCPLPSPTAASVQTKARLGAYFFDGWSGPLTNFHFKGLPFGPYQDRQPSSGWQDNSQCAVEQQLAWAHHFGIDFFVFDWYFNVKVTGPGENLNSALQITHSLPDRHGMQYAILYVNGSPFDVGPADWTSAVNEWVSYMVDPGYVRVNGMPVFFLLNAGQMHQVFGSATAVASALAQLRAAAQAKGLPGVYVVGGFGAPSGTMGQPSLTPGFSIAQSEGYDAVAFYGYPFAPTPVNGMLPFSSLSAAGQWTWNEAVLYSSLPFIPTAMTGWDPRPWNETEPTTGDLMWYSRTPQEVATFVGDAIAWTASNPQLRPEPAPTPPLVLIEAWNEFGEGSHILPTAGDGTSYGDALASMLQGP